MVKKMTPEELFHEWVLPAMVHLEKLTGIKTERNGEALVMTIAGQESDWAARVQHGGPAHSFWQFEKGGGVAGLFRVVPNQLQAVCDYLYIPFDIDSVYQSMIYNDTLAACMARLLLFTDPAPLPALGDVEGGWQYYLRNWRPGAPHPEVWPIRYATVMGIV